jgi:hypothetical protein
VTLTHNLTVLTVLSLLAITTAGCEPHSTESKGPVHCNVVADAPARVPDVDKIASTVRFRCENPGAEELTLSIKLEQRDGEQWRSAVSQTFTLRGQETYAAPLKYQLRQLQIGCATGTFRTVVDWERTSKNDTKGDNLISGTMKDPCKPLFPI